MGFEPTTTCLGSKDSTTELRPPLSTEEPNPTLAPVLSQGNRREPGSLYYSRGFVTKPSKRHARSSTRSITSVRSADDAEPVRWPCLARGAAREGGILEQDGD